MPTPVYQLAFGEKQQFEDVNGNPLAGAKMFVYTAGTSTKATSYQETDGVSANTNPIILDGTGALPKGVYVQTGLYKLVLASSTDSDPPLSPIWTRDQITPVNDTNQTITEWVDAAGGTPTWLTTATFSVTGDQTPTFIVNRRIRVVDSGGTKYGYITAASFGLGVTTVTVLLDSGVLASPISSASLGLLTPTNPSLPLSLDTFPIVSGSVDRSKRLRIEVDGVTTATTRVWTSQDSDGTVAYTSQLNLVQNAQSTNYTVDATDFSKVITCTGTFTLSLTAAATLGAGFWFWVNNVGTGTITIDPNASETVRIAGGPQTAGTTFTLPYSGSTEGPYNVSGVLLWCDGTNWQVVATNETHGSVAFTGNGTWTAPAGVTTAWVTGAGAGGGGGGSTLVNNRGGGGGGGGWAMKTRVSCVPGTAYTVTIGTAGTGGVNVSGNAGTATSLGALITLNGGGGGTIGGAGGAGGTGTCNGGAGSAGAAGGGGTIDGGGGGGSLGAPAPQTAIGGTGPAATGYGGGGSGTSINGNGTGSAGAPGFLLVEW